MPRGENLKALPREERARRLGLEPLPPGEAGRRVYIRAREEVLALLEALPPQERGRVVMAGLEALGYIAKREVREG